MFDYKELAARLFRSRKRAELVAGHKLTFDDVSKLTAKFGRKLTAGQVSEYEKGDAKPKLDALLALAGALGVDPGWLAFGPEKCGAPMVRGASERLVGVEQQGADIAALPAAPDEPIPRKDVRRPRKRAG